MTPLFMVVFIVAAILQFTLLILGEHKPALKYLFSGFVILLYFISFCDICYEIYKRRQGEPPGPHPSQMETVRLMLVIALMVTSSVDVMIFSKGSSHFTLCPSILAAVTCLTIMVEFLGRSYGF